MMTQDEMADTYVRNMPMFKGGGTSDEGLVKELVKCYLSLEYFAKLICPGWVNGPMVWQRKEVFERIHRQEVPFAGEVGFRGITKTTALRLEVIHGACFRTMRFPIIMSKTENYAIGNTEAVRMELMTNPRIRTIFGNMKPQSYNGINPSFSAEAFFLSDESSGEPYFYCTPRGAEQQINGALVNIGNYTYRPDFLGGDDCEDREMVYNEQNRLRFKEWVYGAVLPCVDASKRPIGNRWKRPANDPFWRAPWRVWWSDTIKHEDSFMQNLVSDPMWDITLHPKAEVVEENEKTGERKFRSLVPELVTDEEMNDEIKRYESQGLLNQWAKENLCVPNISGRGRWRNAYFKYYAEQNKHLSASPHVGRFIICDPARTVSVDSCYSAALAIGWDVQNAKIYVRQELCEKLEESALMDRLFEMAIDTNTRIFAIEVTGNEGFIKRMKLRAQNTGLAFRYCEIKAKAIPGDWGAKGEASRKIALGAQALPLYQSGYVEHSEQVKQSGWLERCERAYPDCKYFDPLDCMGYVPLVAQELGLTFMPSIEKDGEPSVRREFKSDATITKNRQRILAREGMLGYN